jgi:hypothetical protein
MVVVVLEGCRLIGKVSGDQTGADGGKCEVVNGVGQQIGRRQQTADWKKTTNVPAIQKIEEFLEGYLCKKYLGATCVRLIFLWVSLIPSYVRLQRKEHCERQ